jgi:hypothetical protein
MPAATPQKSLIAEAQRIRTLADSEWARPVN